MKTFRDKPHVLVVDEYGDLSIEHRPDCPMTPLYDVPPEFGGGTVRDYTCMTAGVWDWTQEEDWVRELAPGRYEVEAWSTPPGWAGSEPIEADGGLELFELAS